MGAPFSSGRSVVFEERRVSDAVIEFASSWEQGAGAGTGTGLLAGDEPGGKQQQKSQQRPLHTVARGDDRPSTRYETKRFRRGLAAILVSALIALLVAKLVLRVEMGLFYPMCLLASVGAAAVYAASRIVIRESVLVVRDLGVQLERWYLAGQLDSVFLERAAIRSVVIHEAVGFCAVHTCIAFELRDAPELAVCFAHIYPGFDSLRRAYVKCVEGGATGSSGSGSMSGGAGSSSGSSSCSSSSSRRALAAGRAAAPTPAPTATTVTSSSAVSASSSTSSPSSSLSGSRRQSASSVLLPPSSRGGGGGSSRSHAHISR